MKTKRHSIFEGISKDIVGFQINIIKNVKKKEEEGYDMSSFIDIKKPPTGPGGTWQSDFMAGGATHPETSSFLESFSRHLSDKKMQASLCSECRAPSNKFKKDEEKYLFLGGGTFTCQQCLTDKGGDSLSYDDYNPMLKDYGDVVDWHDGWLMNYKSERNLLESFDMDIQDYGIVDKAEVDMTTGTLTKTGKKVKVSGEDMKKFPDSAIKRKTVAERTAEAGGIEKLREKKEKHRKETGEDLLD